MSKHKHTDECLAYAAKTGKAYCIASCADSYRTEMTERDEAIRLRAELAREQANVEVLTEAIASYCRERNCWQERAMQAETRLDYAKADLEVVKAERDEARQELAAQLTSKRGPQ